MGILVKAIETNCGGSIVIPTAVGFEPLWLGEIAMVKVQTQDMTLAEPPGSCWADVCPSILRMSDMVLLIVESRKTNSKQLEPHH